MFRMQLFLKWLNELGKLVYTSIPNIIDDFISLVKEYLGLLFIFAIAVFVIDIVLAFLVVR